MKAKLFIPKPHIKAAGEQYLILLKIKTATLALIILLSVVLIIIMAGNRTKATDNVENDKISYISVLVTSNDTLWNIADRYYSDEFGTIKDYIKEIKRCNVLKSDNIYAGRHIIVPVIYQTEGSR